VISWFQNLLLSEFNLYRYDEVVLVGGSTRIPKIQSMLSDFFGGQGWHFSRYLTFKAPFDDSVRGRLER
jgi:hypothetical protein